MNIMDMAFLDMKHLQQESLGFVTQTTTGYGKLESVANNNIGEQW